MAVRDKARDRSHRRLAALIGLHATFLGCVERDAVKAGPPVLEAFEIVDLTGAPVPLAGGAATVSPRVHFVLRFDRLLEGRRIEDVSAGAAVVRLTGPGPLSAPLTYIPNGDPKLGLVFARGPSIVVTPAPTLPSGTLVTVTIDKSQIRGKAGEGPLLFAAGLADVITFTTEPFAATITAAGADPMAGDGGPARLDRQARLNVAFNNLPAADLATQIAVTVLDAAGAPVPDPSAAPAPDPSDPSVWVIAPKADWPAGATITVTVAASAADALGVAIGTEQRAVFNVQP